MKYEVINIRTVGNEAGGLSFFEGEHDIPFNIKHLFCIYETKYEAERVFDVGTASQLLLFCPYGEVEIIVNDDLQQKSIVLNSPTVGLVLQNGIWDRIEWKQEKSVLCVAASERLEEHGA